MCGRFSRKATLQAIVDEFEIEEQDEKVKPSYNVAPGQEIAVVLKDENKKLSLLKWGLIPSWAKDPTIGSRMINARAETLSEKPSFKHSLRRKRCIIIADGFYEWKKEGAHKIPMYIFLKSGKLFGFAGLWDTWTAPEGNKIATCTIITTSPNKLIEEIHNRMPVILPKENVDRWLDPSIQDESKVLPLLQPYPADEMDAYPVSRLVNSPKNNSPEVIKKADDMELG
jgi:putative SOS response-associated peptidase YedK